MLQSAKTGTYLQEYLGQHYDVFLGTLGRYESCLKLVARKLKDIRRLSQVHVINHLSTCAGALPGVSLTACQVANDHLSALLVASPPGEKGFAFHERILFSIENGRLVQLIEELNQNRLSLMLQ